MSLDARQAQFAAHMRDRYWTRSTDPPTAEVSVKASPTVLYLAEKDDGEILLDRNGNPLVDTARGELVDRASDLHGPPKANDWRAVPFDRRRGYA